MVGAHHAQNEATHTLKVYPERVGTFSLCRVVAASAVVVFVVVVVVIDGGGPTQTPSRTLARKQRRKAASTGPRLKIMPPDCCGCHSSRTGGSAGDTRHQSSPPLAQTCTGGKRDFDPAGAQVPDS